MSDKSRNLFKPSQLGYYAGWWWRTFFGARRPLVNTLIIGYECNLRCQHCEVAKTTASISGPHRLGYEKAVEKLKEIHRRGARVAYFEGGEPSLWRDGERRLVDLIRAAREIGYFTTGYTTNGSQPFCEESDVISISLDGPAAIHDEIRGAGAFQQLMERLDKANHRNIFANLTLTKTNVAHLRETAKLAAEHPKIQGLLFNLLTPPPAEIALGMEQKREAVEQVLQLKREGYPILNTRRALLDLLEPGWGDRCPDWMSIFVLPDGTELGGCPMRSKGACAECGFDAPREFYRIARGNPSTIIEMSRRFALSRK